MKKVFLIVVLVSLTWFFTSIVHATGYIYYVGLLKTNEDRNSDTSNKINAISGEVVNFLIVAQDIQGNDGLISSGPTLETVGNLDGHEMKITKNIAGTWPESQDLMHFNITIPLVYSENQICNDVVLRLTTTILTAHNQYTNVIKERTIRACSIIDSQSECSDGIDNDHDGAIDYPDDFGCLSINDNSEIIPKSQCQDGKDNDGDGMVDLQDTGCFSSQDNDETNIVATPSPTLVPSTPSSIASIEPTTTPSPTTSFFSDESSPIIDAISPSPYQFSPSPTIVPDVFRGTGKTTSASSTAVAVIATMAGAISVINIVLSIASVLNQAISSFENFFFGIFSRKKERSEHWVKVVDSITGKGVGGSMIQVRTPDGKVRTIWRTDDKTGDTGDLLPPGEYEFAVTKGGWRFPSSMQPVFAKQKGDIIYRRGIIEVGQDGKVIVKGDKNEQ